MKDIKLKEEEVYKPVCEPKFKEDYVIYRNFKILKTDDKLDFNTLKEIDSKYTKFKEYLKSKLDYNHGVSSGYWKVEEYALRFDISNREDDLTIHIRFFYDHVIIEEDWISRILSREEFDTFLDEIKNYINNKSTVKHMIKIGYNEPCSDYKLNRAL